MPDVGSEVCFTALGSKAFEVEPEAGGGEGGGGHRLRCAVRNTGVASACVLVGGKKLRARAWKSCAASQIVCHRLLCRHAGCVCVCSLARQFVDRLHCRHAGCLVFIFCGHTDRLRRREVECLFFISFGISEFACWMLVLYLLAPNCTPAVVYNVDMLVLCLLCLLVYICCGCSETACNSHMLDACSFICCGPPVP